MKYFIFLLIGVSVYSCKEQEDVFAPYTTDTAPVIDISIDDVQTYDELEAYLRNRYGGIQPLPSIWEATSPSINESSKGPYRFRLQDGTEISIDGIYARDTGQIVDPNFDLRSLPDPIGN